MTNSRLSYTRSGFLRRLMMASNDSIFIIVEGKDLDRPFYDTAVGSSSKIEAAGYQIWLIEQIRDDQSQKAAGGKSAVLSFYEYCKKRNSLTVYSGSVKRVLAFCVDKDADHISGGRKRSPHVIYTCCADVEAEIFMWGDEVRALGNALGIHRALSLALAGMLGDWRSELAQTWQEWIELCCLAKALRSRCSVGFGHRSTINVNTFGALDARSARNARQLVIARGLYNQSRSGIIEAVVAARVKGQFSRGQGKYLVKGKWYPGFLVWRISNMKGAAPMQLNGAEKYLAKAFLGTLDPAGPWVKHYHKKFEALL